MSLLHKPSLITNNVVVKPFGAVYRPSRCDLQLLPGRILTAFVPPRLCATGSHRVFIEDAVAAQIEYFVTDYQPWLQLDRDWQIRPDLRIVTGRQFVRLARQIDR